MPSLRLGVIGYGERARHMSSLMCQQEVPAHVAAIADWKHEEIRAEMQAAGKDTYAIQFYGTADEMLAREPLDGVVIGTRCSHHTPMALKVLEHGLPLFLEKPVSTTFSDLQALLSVAKQLRKPKVVVSFPLRVSSLVNLARDVIASGQIGMVEHVQAWNNVSYGDVYFQSWYRDENETGGLFLQKATHDFDYINSLLGGNRPVCVSAIASKQIFRGDHPAGLHCMDCAERTICYESPYHRSRSYPLPLDQPAKTQCAFAVDTGNEDSGSALIQYESGMHVAYSQNFFVRNQAGKRGARLMGYKGTLEFDWCTGLLQIFMHHSAQVITHKFEEAGGHGGGDGVLAANFLKVITGAEEPVATLNDGLLSALLCLKAKESARTRTFQTITF